MNAVVVSSLARPVAVRVTLRAFRVPRLDGAVRARAHTPQNSVSNRLLKIFSLSD